MALTATFDTTDTGTHTVRTKAGGVLWANTPFTQNGIIQKVAAIDGVVFMKAGGCDVNRAGGDFGRRWDMQTQEPANAVFGWFGHADPVGTEGSVRCLCTFHQSFKYSETHGCDTILAVQTPGLGEAAQGVTPDGEHGWWWGTPAYKAGLVQYLLGTADGDWSTQIDNKITAGKVFLNISPNVNNVVSQDITDQYQTAIASDKTNFPLRLAMDFHDAANAAFNWANLRAARGQVAPFTTIVGVQIGMEPYWADAAHTGTRYGTQYKRVADAIRALSNPTGSTVPLGFHTRNQTGGAVTWEDDAVAALGGYPAAGSTYIDFVLTQHLYDGMGQGGDENIPYRRAMYNAIQVPPANVQGTGFCNTSGVRGSGAPELDLSEGLPIGFNHCFGGWHVEFSARPGRYSDHIKEWVTEKSLPAGLIDKITISEWGVSPTIPATFGGDLRQSLMMAGYMAEAIKEDYWSHGFWTAGNEPPFNYGLTYRTGNHPTPVMNETPGYQAAKLLSEMAGNEYVPITLSSPNFVHFPPRYSNTGIQLNYLDTYLFKNGTKRWIFAINRHDTEDINIPLPIPDLSADLEITGWKQVGGRGYAELNEKNIPIVDKAGSLPTALTFEPLSFTLVELDDGTPPPPPPTQSTTLGYEDLTGATAVAVSNDQMILGFYKSPSTGNITKIRAYLDGQGGPTSGNQRFRYVVYAADAVDFWPGTRLRQTAEFSVTNGSAAQWYEVTLGTPIPVTQGDYYYIGIIAGGASGVMRRYRQVNTNSGTSDVPNYTSTYTKSYSAGSPNPFVYSGTPPAGDPPATETFDRSLFSTVVEGATAPNVAPTATIVAPSGNVTIQAGQSVIFNGSGTDSDGLITGYNWQFPGGTPLTSGAQNPGSVFFNNPGSFVCTLVVTDDDGAQSAAASRTITVDALPPPNHAPVAVDDVATTLENTPVIIPVLSNDTDVDGDALTVTNKTNGTNGTVAISADNTFVTYTPNAGFDGDDTFTYTVSDGDLTDTGTVVVTVVPVNAPPTAVILTPSATSLSIRKGNELYLSGQGVDPDGNETVVGHLWTFGGAGIADNTNQVPGATAFPNEGTFTVSYVVTDDRGTASAADSFEVTVLPSPCEEGAFDIAIVDEAEKTTSNTDPVTVTVPAAGVAIGDLLVVAVLGDVTAATVTVADSGATNIYTSQANISHAAASNRLWLFKCPVTAELAEGATISATPSQNSRLYMIVAKATATDHSNSLTGSAASATVTDKTLGTDNQASLLVVALASNGADNPTFTPNQPEWDELTQIDSSTQTRHLKLLWRLTTSMDDYVFSGAFSAGVTHHQVVMAEFIEEVAGGGGEPGTLYRTVSRGGAAVRFLSRMRGRRGRSGSSDRRG